MGADRQHGGLVARDDMDEIDSKGTTGLVRALRFV